MAAMETPFSVLMIYIFCGGRGHVHFEKGGVFKGGERGGCLKSVLKEVN